MNEETEDKETLGT